VDGRGRRPAARDHRAPRVEIERSSDLIANRLRDALSRPGIEVVEVPVRANNFFWEIR